jgi:hypothetical protein
MWITTTKGFFSITHAPRSPRIQIRARVKQHLETLIRDYPSLLKEQEIDSISGTDYAHRIYVTKYVMTALLVLLGTEIDYSNFKDAVHLSGDTDADYTNALTNVWGVMLRTQITRDITPRASNTFRDDKMEIKANSGPFEASGDLTRKGILVEDETVVGGTDAETGAPVIKPKTTEGQADESVTPTDTTENATNG